jgi:hypothetical protein
MKTIVVCLAVLLCGCYESTRVPDLDSAIFSDLELNDSGVVEPGDGGTLISIDPETGCVEWVETHGVKMHFKCGEGN